MNETLHARAASAPGKLIFIAGVAVLYGCLWGAFAIFSRAITVLLWSFATADPAYHIDGFASLYLALVYGPIEIVPYIFPLALAFAVVLAVGESKERDLVRLSFGLGVLSGVIQLAILALVYPIAGITPELALFASPAFLGSVGAGCFIGRMLEHD